MILVPITFISSNDVSISLRLTVLFNRLTTSYMWCFKLILIKEN